MAEVTKRHRLLTYRALRNLDAPPADSIAERWVEDGKAIVQSEWNRTSQALADIEAAALATRASAVEPGEAEHLEEGARLLLMFEKAGDIFDCDSLATWLNAERIRRAKR